jgi:hypothetical protein
MILGLQYESGLLVLVSRIVALKPWHSSIFVVTILFLANIIIYQFVFSPNGDQQFTAGY